jgi:hypothetical protein
MRALLERVRLDQLIDVIGAWRFDQSLDLDRPRPGHELLRVGFGVFFLRAELVEVVVPGHVVVVVRRLGGAERTLPKTGELGATALGGCRCRRQRRRGRHSRARCRLDELTPAQIQRFGRDL